MIRWECDMRGLNAAGDLIPVRYESEDLPDGRATVEKDGELIATAKNPGDAMAAIFEDMKANGLRPSHTDIRRL